MTVRIQFSHKAQETVSAEYTGIKLVDFAKPLLLHILLHMYNHWLRRNE